MNKSITFSAILIIIINIIIVIAVIAGIVYLCLHPELIGEFFGKIVNGFNNTK